MYIKFLGTTLCLLCSLASFPGIAQANITIKSESVNLTDFEMSYYVDDSQSMDLEQIRLQDFIDSSNKLALGTKAKTTWSKIILNNASGQDLNLFFHHPYAYHNHKIEFFQESNGQLKKELLLDLDDPNAYPHMYGGVAIFDFTLAAGTSDTFYIKTVSYSHQWFTLEILDEENSKRALVGNQNDIAILVGTLIALMLYNFILYLSSRKRENILYSLYLISGTVWIALSYGLLANFFGWYGDAVMNLHISLITMPIFLILFMVSVFETKQNYPTEHKFLIGMLVILVADFGWGLFDIKAALEPASTLAAMMMLLTCSVCISILRKGNPLAKLFLIGHSMFICFNVLAVLYYKGLADFMYVTCYGVGIGIALEALMLAFILSYRIKLLEKIKASQENLKHLASTDAMTALFNRRYFNDNAADIVQQSLANQMACSLIITDLDRFKQINDNFGHQTGDKVITEFAGILRSCVRKQDLVARFGGEEFVILLTDCNHTKAQQIAETIRQQVLISEIYLPQQSAIKYTASFGVTEIVQNKDTLEQALNRADIALYQAKNAGRNQVAVQLNNSDELLQVSMDLA